MPRAGLAGVMTYPLELEGQLYLMFNDDILTLSAAGDTAVLTLPSFRCALAIYQGLPSMAHGAQPNHGVEALVVTGLRLNIAIGSHVLFSAGAGCRPSRLLQRLGFPPVRLHWAALLRSLLPL
jgi:hypothetical protein